MSESRISQLENNYNSKKLGGALVYTGRPTTGGVDPQETILVAMPACVWARLLQDQAMMANDVSRGPDATGNPEGQDGKVYAETPAETARRNLRMLLDSQGVDIYGWFDEPFNGEDS